MSVSMCKGVVMVAKPGCSCTKCAKALRIAKIPKKPSIPLPLPPVCSQCGKSNSPLEGKICQMCIFIAFDPKSASQLSADRHVALEAAGCFAKAVTGKKMCKGDGKKAKPGCGCTKCAKACRREICGVQA